MDLVDDRSLFPYQDSQSIGSVENRWILWIVGEAQEIESILFYDPQIADMEAVGNRVTDTGMILMTIRAAQFQMSAIEKESLRGVELEPAKSERVGNVIKDLSLLANDGSHRVEIRLVRRPE